MSERRRFVRRNRVDERWALAIAAVAGLVAATAGASPTGQPGVDAVLVFVGAGFVTWASASAPWWAPAAASGVGAAIALDPLVAAIGAIGFVVGLAVGLRQRDQSELRAVVGGIAVNVLIRSELGGFLGLSAVIAVATCLALVIVGLLRRPSKIRRAGFIALGAVGAAAVVAIVALAAVGIGTRPDLSTGARQARHAITRLNEGDYEGAAELFEQSSDAFRRADDRLSSPLTMPSLLIPGVAINVAASSDLAAAAADGTTEAAAALRAIDPSTLRVEQGAIDLDAVAALAEPLEQVQDALVDLRAAADDVESPWLAAPLQDELVDLDERLDTNEPRLINAIDAVRLAPQLLGADEPRRYLLLFTSPAEIRGVAGFIGNYADVTIDDGRITVNEFGRRAELEQVVAERGASCPDLPPELLERFGRFGLTNGPDGGASDRVWSNLTMPAHFPYVAEAAQCLYPQSGGEPVDGVIAMDPYVVQALMKYTGPIGVPELGVTVQPEQAADFIMRRQYVLAGDDANEERIDALQTLGEEVIGRLLAGSLPEPSTLARELGPLAAEGRLLVWTDDPEEQELLDRVGMSGALPEPGDDGGFAVYVGNAGESKIDVFLDRETDVRIEEDSDGTRTLVADVTLTNNAPASGLPDYVIGNGYGLPTGTSRLNLSFYGPIGLSVMERQGEPVAAGPMTEAGWQVYSLTDVIGPGESVQYRLEFDLPRSGTGNPAEWRQPLARRGA